jgi:TPP-dependent pyruvate/acetoin dehydrogenase alpha subunit
MYERLLFIREFENRLASLYRDKKIRRPIYSSYGQEACGVGVGMALTDSDYLILNHRGLHYFLSRGADPGIILSETGSTNQHAGHYYDVKKRILPYTEVAGGNFGIAVGTALALRQKQENGTCVCVFGEGAASHGTFHSSLNLSALWKLPVLWICESNQYAISTPKHKVAVGSIADRAIGYGMKHARVDGNNCIAVYQATRTALRYIHTAHKPVLLELETYRRGAHAVLDLEPYKTETEVARWEMKDPLHHMHQLLRVSRLLTASTEHALKLKIAQTLQVLFTPHGT